MWDPWKDVDSFVRQIASLHQGLGGSGFFTSSKGSWTPAMDFVESEKAYQVTLDLPGVKREDMEVLVENNRLCVSGNRALSDKVTENTASNWFVLNERGVGRFERCVQLPQRIVESSLKAALANGVLDVTMDKADPKAARPGSRVNIE